MNKDPDFGEHFQEGLKRFESGKFAESLEEFFNAAQIDPSSSALHFYIGEALEKHKQQLVGDDPADQPRVTSSQPRVTGGYAGVTQEIESASSTNQETGKRSVNRFNTRIPLIVVAYDISGKFFAELGMTRVTSVKGAALEMQRQLAVGCQLMLFTIDSRNAVPATVRNIQFNQERNRFTVGLEFLKGPVKWLVPE